MVASCNVAMGGLWRPLEAKEKEATCQEFQRIAGLKNLQTICTGGATDMPKARKQPCRDGKC